VKKASGCRFNEFGVLRQAVLEGLGIGLLLESSAREDFAQRRLRRVLPEYRLDGGGLWAVYPSAHHSRPRCACSSISCSRGSLRRASARPALGA